MGMYTGLRGFVKFKEEYVSDIQCYMKRGVEDWYDLRQIHSVVSFRAFATDERSMFIPFGAVCYMPDEWGASRCAFEDDTMSFTCSLKNYDRTIEKFLACLPDIAYEWRLEKLYEEDSDITLFTSEVIDD